MADREQLGVSADPGMKDVRRYGLSGLGSQTDNNSPVVILLWPVAKVSRITPPSSRT